MNSLEFDVAAINNVFKEMAASANAGDIDRWTSLWAEDAIEMPAGAASVVGRQQIGNDLAGSMNQFTIEEAITVEEIEVAGKWAFSSGRHTAILNPKGEGQSFLIDGKSMTILLRQSDGGWKIYRSIWNSNVPRLYTPQ